MGMPKKTDEQLSSPSGAELTTVMDFRTFVEDRSTVNVFPVEKDPECFSKQLKHLPLDRSDFSLVTFQAAAPAPNESLEIANSLKNVGKNSALGLTKEAIQMDGADFDSIDKLPARALLPYLVKSGFVLANNLCDEKIFSEEVIEDFMLLEIKYRKSRIAGGRLVETGNVITFDLEVRCPKGSFSLTAQQLWTHIQKALLEERPDPRMHSSRELRTLDEDFRSMCKWVVEHFTLSLYMRGICIQAIDAWLVNVSLPFDLWEINQVGNFDSHAWNKTVLALPLFFHRCKETQRRVELLGGSGHDFSAKGVKFATGAAPTDQERILTNSNRHVCRKLLWSLVEGAGLQDFFVEDAVYENGNGGVVHGTYGFFFRQARKVAEGDWNRLISRSLVLLVSKLEEPFVNALDFSFFASWDLKITLADYGDLAVSETGLISIWHQMVIMQAFHAAEWKWEKKDFLALPKWSPLFMEVSEKIAFLGDNRTLKKRPLPMVLPGLEAALLGQAMIELVNFRIDRRIDGPLAKVALDKIPALVSMEDRMDFKRAYADWEKYAPREVRGESQPGDPRDSYCYEVGIALTKAREERLKDESSARHQEREDQERADAAARRAWFNMFRN